MWNRWRRRLRNRRIPARFLPVALRQRVSLQTAFCVAGTRLPSPDARVSHTPASARIISRITGRSDSLHVARRRSQSSTCSRQFMTDGLVAVLRMRDHVDSVCNSCAIPAGPDCPFAAVAIRLGLKREPSRQATAKPTPYRWDRDAGPRGASKALGHTFLDLSSDFSSARRAQWCSPGNCALHLRDHKTLEKPQFPVLLTVSSPGALGRLLPES